MVFNHRGHREHREGGGRARHEGWFSFDWSTRPGSVHSHENASTHAPCLAPPSLWSLCPLLLKTTYDTPPHSRCASLPPPSVNLFFPSVKLCVPPPTTRDHTAVVLLGKKKAKEWPPTIRYLEKGGSGMTPQCATKLRHAALVGPRTTRQSSLPITPVSAIQRPSRESFTTHTLSRTRRSDDPTFAQVLAQKLA